MFLHCVQTNTVVKSLFVSCFYIFHLLLTGLYNRLEVVYCHFTY
uniref:Uncharacterized protein n=1 Tax=Anguilla anguilla TaxID=7936 RepID=A0A0E9VJQ7_ANGAN